MRLSRFVSLMVLVLLSISLLPMATSAEGNSEAAHLCQKGGWGDLQGADGTTFTNQDECVSHAAQGGTLVPKTPPVITATAVPVMSLAWGPSFTITGTGSNFPPNQRISVRVFFDGRSGYWTHGATSDSQGTLAYSFAGLEEPCTYLGHEATVADVLAYDSTAWVLLASTTITDIPCE